MDEEEVSASAYLRQHGVLHALESAMLVAGTEMVRDGTPPLQAVSNALQSSKFRLVAFWTSVPAG